MSSAAVDADQIFDFVIVGAGSAGLLAAIFASRRGARVLVVDAADKVGGTLHLSAGQIAGANTKLQQSLGIKDNIDLHYRDIMRLSEQQADPNLIRLMTRHAGRTVDWLLTSGLEPLPGHPLTGERLGREGYSVRRYLWAENGARAILSIARREFRRELGTGRVTLLLNSAATALETDRQGRVTGLCISTPNGTACFKGRHILLTTGGYASNPDMFRRLNGLPNYVNSAYPWSQGDGINLAVSVGGFLRGRECYRTGFGSILDGQHYPTKKIARFTTLPQRRQPWEIWVNLQGNRFIREDESSEKTRERALRLQPQLSYWIVFDQAIFENAPIGIPEWSYEKLLATFGTHPAFVRAASLEDLAAACDLDLQRVGETVTAYNNAVAAGSDSLGRRFMPMPLSQPPFYAIRQQGYSATSSVGVVVDGNLRVLRGADGNPVPNLYAAGEVLGSGATMGDCFVPGMTLTPALTFGRLLGSTLPLNS